jgi:hypothetical protein
MTYSISEYNELQEEPKWHQHLHALRHGTDGIETGISTRALAVAIGTPSTEMVARWLRQDQRPRIDRVIRIRDLFKEHGGKLHKS